MPAMKLSRTLIISIIAFIVLTLSLIYSIQVNRANEGKMQMHNSAKNMKEEIIKSLPIGSSLTDAQKVMEANGFVCLKQEQGRFLELDTENMQSGVLHQNIDYLWCDKELSDTWYCSRRWQIAIVYRADVVSDIIVSIGRGCL